jgi:hypothetical protein
LNQMSLHDAVQAISDPSRSDHEYLQECSADSSWN